MKPHDDTPQRPATGDWVAATPTCFLGFDPWVAFACLRQAGVRFVEVPALPARQSIEWRQTTFSPELLGPAGTAQLSEQLGALGLVPVTVGAYASILSSDDFGPLLRRIDFAKDLGASFLIIDAAGDEPRTTDEWRRVGTLGRFLGDYSQVRGIRLAFEIHEGLARSGKAARILLEAIDHEAVGVNYDTGNVVFYNDDTRPESDIEEIADRVFHVHLKDTSGGKGDWAFGALGTGHVHLRAVVDILKRHHFRGPYSLEIEGFAREDLTRSAIIERVRQSLRYLDTLGIDSRSSLFPDSASTNHDA
jgi:L-ribulose-5-phosphate 3-epimerase